MLPNSCVLSVASKQNSSGKFGITEKFLKNTLKLIFHIPKHTYSSKTFRLLKLYKMLYIVAEMLTRVLRLCGAQLFVRINILTPNHVEKLILFVK